MPEKSALDSRFQGRPYEKDPSLDTKGEVIFRKSKKDLEEGPIIQLYLNQLNSEIQKQSPGQELSLEKFLEIWNKSPKESQLSALEVKRKQIVMDFIFNYYSRSYAKIDSKGTIDPKLARPLISEVKKYVEEIGPRYFGDYSDITDITIIKGILNITRGDKVAHIDLVHANVRDVEPRRALLLKKTEEDARILKEQISTDVYMAGAISVQYERVDSDTRQAMSNIIAVTVAGHALLTPVYRIYKIKVRNKDGKMEEVVMKNKKEGSKADLEKSLFSSLRSSGYIFDVAARAFISTTRHAIEQSIHTIALSTFDQYRQISGVSDTPENRMKFEEARKSMMIEAKKMLNPSYSQEQISRSLEAASKKLATIGMSVLNMGMETMFWGVFFTAYHKNTQDLAGAASGVAEVALFRTGMIAGKFIPAPPILKPFVPMLGGMAFSIGGHLGASASGMDKRFWKYFPDREDYWQKNGSKEGNSIAGNILTAGPLNELYDSKKMDVRIGKREGIDINIPFSNGKKWTIGSLDIGRSTVDMSTPPWEYMSEWIGRDVDSWNSQVKEYQEWLTTQVLNLFRQYDEGKGVFEKGNVMARMNGRSEHITKKEILETRLGRLFPHYSKDSAEHNGKTIDTIIRQSIENIDIKPESRRIELTKWFIEQMINTYMTIDSETLRMYGLEMERDSNSLDQFVDLFIQEFNDPKIQSYIREIFGYSDENGSSYGRIFDKKKLVSLGKNDTIEPEKNKYIITRGKYGGPERKLSEGWEHRTFHMLIDSDNLIKNRILKEVYGGGKDVSISDVFYQLLNKKVELKRMKDFVKNVGETGRAQKWNAGFLEVLGME